MPILQLNDYIDDLQLDIDDFVRRLDIVKQQIHEEPGEDSDMSFTDKGHVFDMETNIEKIKERIIRLMDSFSKLAGEENYENYTL